MRGWFKSNAATIRSWLALIAGALIIFWATRGTQFQQLGIGLLMASVSLLVAMAVFEAIWLALMKLLNHQGEEKSA